MGELQDTGALHLPPEVEEVIALDRERVAHFADVIGQDVRTIATVTEPFEDTEHARSVTEILDIGSYTDKLADCGDMYLRSAASMSWQQLEHDVDTVSVFNAMERVRTSLKRVMLGIEFPGDPNLCELYGTFLHTYLPRLSARTEGVFFSRSPLEACNEEVVAEAAAVATFMGRSVLLPVMRASSVLFEEVLRTEKSDVQSAEALKYFRRNLEASRMRLAE